MLNKRLADGQEVRSSGFRKGRQFLRRALVGFVRDKCASPPTADDAAKYRLAESNQLEKNVTVT
jgi:hypothetical protein